MQTAAIIPSDSPSIFDVIKSLTTLEQQAIIRPTNPPPGIAGFLFDIVLNDRIELNSTTSDHFIENNTTVTDQVALSPEVITLRGLVAELASLQPSQGRLAVVPDALPIVDDFTPDLTPAALEQETEDTADTAAIPDSITASQSLFAYYNAQSAQQPNQTKQTKAFLYLYQLWKSRIPFSVETPWGIMNNVIIQTLTNEQGEESKGQSETRITLKKLRFVEELTITTGQLAGRAALQAAPVVKNGNAGKTPQTDAQKQSWLYSMLHPGS